MTCKTTTEAAYYLLTMEIARESTKTISKSE